MNKIKDRLLAKKRVKEDAGAANTVSFIVIILFVMTLLISMVDIGIYFNVKNEMRGAAEAGARNVALYGGTAGMLRAERSNSTDATDVAKSAIFSNYDSKKVVDIKEVSCGPNATGLAGDPVWCEVDYLYKGIAGKFSLFQIANTKVKVKGVAASEVGHK